jgi:hypothetical protein
MVIILAVAVLHARGVFVQAPSRTIAPPPPQVAVSAPLQRDVDGRLEFLGQFSAVDHLELRAQVGGALTQIGFKDGDIVHKGIDHGELDAAFGQFHADALPINQADLVRPKFLLRPRLSRELVIGQPDFADSRRKKLFS